MLKRNSEHLIHGSGPVFAHPENDFRDADESGSFDLRSLLAIARRRIKVIAGVTLVGTLLAVIYALQLTSVYTATAAVLVEPRQTNIINTEAVLSGITGDWGAIESEVQLIKSTSVAERVVDKLNLTERRSVGEPSFLQLLWRGLFSREAGETPAVNKDELRSSMARSLAAGVQAARRGDSYLITISYSHPDPKFAAAVVNGFADAYLVDQLESKFEATERASGWLSERLGGLRERVQAAERAVATYRAENNLTESAGSTLSDQQVGQLNEQLVLARAQTAEAKAKLDQLNEILARGGDASSFAGALQSDVIGGLQGKLSEAQRQYAELTSKYGARHPSVITASAQLADVRNQIQTEVNRIKAFSENEYRVAHSREESLSASLRQMEVGVANLSQAEVRLRELERDAAAEQALYESFLTRFKETSEQESLQTADSRIIERAAPPRAPSAPNRKSLALMGLFLSLSAGAGLAYVLESFDRGFRTSGQIQDALGVPLLASVPQIEGLPTVNRSLLSRLPWAAKQTSNSDREKDSRKLAARYVVEKPLSPFTEAVRSLRMGIRFADIDSPPKIVMITSALPGEGKSTIASNLAQHAANTGERVLLFDMDAHHPALSAIYSPDSKLGLMEILSGSARIAEVTKTLSGKADFRFIPASRVGSAAHSAEMLGSAKVRELLEGARQSFDLIVIDSPPLIPVADSRALVDAVDAVVLVVQWEKTSRDAVHAALSQTFGLREKLAGSVLSRVDPSRARYYDYYKSGYYAVENPYYSEKQSAEA